MHHITMITGDATRNVEFYADVLGLRLAAYRGKPSSGIHSQGAA